MIQLEACQKAPDVLAILLALGQQTHIEDPLHSTQFELGRSQTGSGTIFIVLYLFVFSNHRILKKSH